MDVDQLREHLRSKRIWPFPGHGAFVPHSEMEDVLNLEMVLGQGQQNVLSYFFPRRAAGMNIGHTR